MDIKRSGDNNETYLNECADKLLRIKLGNNRVHNNLNRVQNDISYENKREASNINFEFEKYLEELKKREFSFDAFHDVKQSKKKINNIEFIPIRNNVREKNKEDKPKELEK